MSQIGLIFDTTNIEDDVEKKYDDLDMWVRKIENIEASGKFIQPRLYADIKTYVEQALLYDFNMLIEEFKFFD